MWQCPGCGCRGIAHDLMFCPLCLKERDMPAISRDGGATNSPEVTRQAPAPEPAPAVVLAEPAQEPARGGVFAGPIPLVVGESGPEVTDLPPGAHVAAQPAARAAPVKATKSTK